MYDWTENYYQNDKNVARPITDLDLAMGTHPLSKDIRRKRNIEAIKQSVKTLVLLNHYEKPFHPDIGCDIHKSLFELFEGTFSTEMVKGFIHNVIDNYEPRADIQDIQVIAREDQHEFTITVYFIPVGETETVSVDIFLKIQR